MLTFYCLLVLFYVAGIGLYAHRVWITISKGGPMHEVSLSGPKYGAAQVVEYKDKWNLSIMDTLGPH